MKKRLLAKNEAQQRILELQLTRLKKEQKSSLSKIDDLISEDLEELRKKWLKNNRHKEESANVNGSAMKRRQFTHSSSSRQSKAMDFVKTCPDLKYDAAERKTKRVNYAIPIIVISYPNTNYQESVGMRGGRKGLQCMHRRSKEFEMTVDLIRSESLNPTDVIKTAPTDDGDDVDEVKKASDVKAVNDIVSECVKTETSGEKINESMNEKEKIRTDSFEKNQGEGEENELPAEKEIPENSLENACKTSRVPPEWRSSLLHDDDESFVSKNIKLSKGNFKAVKSTEFCFPRNLASSPMNVKTVPIKCKARGIFEKPDQSDRTIKAMAENASSFEVALIENGKSEVRNCENDSKEKTQLNLSVEKAKTESNSFPHLSEQRHLFTTKNRTESSIKNSWIHGGQINRFNLAHRKTAIGLPVFIDNHRYQHLRGTVRSHTTSNNYSTQRCCSGFDNGHNMQKSRDLEGLSMQIGVLKKGGKMKEALQQNDVNYEMHSSKSLSELFKDLEDCSYLRCRKV